jgi:hypothetical protein
MDAMVWAWMSGRVKFHEWARMNGLGQEGEHMKQKEVRDRLLKMNLQHFAEAGEGGTGEGAGEGSTGDGGAEPGGESGTNEPQSFDDFLKGDGNQAEFDRRVQQAVNSAVNNAQKKWQMMTDDKVSEAEKLAKMNKEEKTQYLQQKKERELNERENAIVSRELMAEAKNTLAEKKLPVELADVLNYSDADACKKSIEAVETAFQKAVEAAVEAKLKGGNPPKNPDTDESLDKIIFDAMSGN